MKNNRNQTIVDHCSKKLNSVLLSRKNSMYFNNQSKESASKNLLTHCENVRFKNTLYTYL